MFLYTYRKNMKDKSDPMHVIDLKQFVEFKLTMDISRENYIHAERKAKE